MHHDDQSTKLQVGQRAHPSLLYWPAGTSGFARKVNAGLVGVLTSGTAALHLALVAMVTPGPMDGYVKCRVTLVGLGNGLLDWVRFPGHITSHEWVLLPWIGLVGCAGAAVTASAPATTNLAVLVVRLSSLAVIGTMSTLLVSQLWLHYVGARFWSVGDGLGPWGYWLHAVVYLAVFPLVVWGYRSVQAARYEDGPAEQKSEREILNVDTPQRGPARIVEDGFGSRHGPASPAAKVRSASPLDAHAASDPQLARNVVQKQGDFR